MAMSDEFKDFLSKLLIFIGLLLLAISLYAFPARADEIKSIPSVEITREITIHVGEPLRTIDIRPLEDIQKNKEIDLIARLIEAEAGLSSIPFGEKVCVGLTVLHRVDDPAFPNNVESNVYMGSQYTVPAETASETSRRAAGYAYDLWENGESYDYLPAEALYFKGDGKNNHFHDVAGNKYEDLDILKQEEPVEEILYIDVPEIDIIIPNTSQQDILEITVSSNEDILD